MGQVFEVPPNSRMLDFEDSTSKQRTPTDQPAPKDGCGGDPFRINTELSKIRFAVVHHKTGHTGSVLIGVIRGEILSGSNICSKIGATRAKGNHPKLRLARQINCLSTFVVLEHLGRFTGIFRLVPGVRVEHLRAHLRNRSARTSPIKSHGSHKSHSPDERKFVA